MLSRGSGLVSRLSCSVYMCLLVRLSVLCWFLGFGFVFAQEGGRGRLVHGFAARAGALHVSLCLLFLYVVVCVGWREKGCMHRTRLRVHVLNVSVCTGTKPTCFIHVGLVPVHTGTF